MLRPTLTALLLCFAGCAFVGCVQTRPSAPSLDAPRTAIERAENLGATDRAAGELHLAQRKLSEAEAAVAAGASERAHRLAEAALLHAELAETITLAAQAREVLEEVLASTLVLREEIERTRPADQ